jgi:hypothetical protein
VRERREPTVTWLPSTQEIFMAAERPVLAALDACLQLAIRSLRAEYPGLDERGRLVQDPDWEPHVPPQVPLIEPLIGAATALRRLLANYRVALELALHDGSLRQDVDEEPSEQASDEKDIPF